MPRGLYRDDDVVRVAYGENEFVPISREVYEARGYLPLFETLPTREEYNETKRNGQWPQSSG